MLSPQVANAPATATTLTFTPETNPTPKLTHQPSITYDYIIQAKHYLKGSDKVKVNVYYKFVTLVSLLFATDHINLILFEDKTNPISEGSAVPKDEKELKCYCKDSHVSKNRTLHYVFRIQCHDVKFFGLKQEMLPWLIEKQIYI